MTTTQRDALEKIEAVLNLWRKRFEEIKGNLPANATPSDWLSVVTLTNVHKVRRSTIGALVRQGVLEERASDGFGTQVRFVHPLQCDRQRAYERGHYAGYNERSSEEDPYNRQWREQRELSREWQRGYSDGVEHLIKQHPGI